MPEKIYLHAIVVGGEIVGYEWFPYPVNNDDVCYTIDKVKTEKT